MAYKFESPIHMLGDLRRGVNDNQYSMLFPSFLTS